MTLPEALEFTFNDSSRITRRAWNNRAVYCSVIEGKLCISGYDDTGTDDKRPHPWTITESDWFSDDWETLE
jgi:hypothetical protein